MTFDAVLIAIYQASGEVWMGRRWNADAIFMGESS
jgi:hypothetical protein